ncbi:MAG: hypothetical protein A2700_00695 [Candidatus Blackburnbacteria bacterium RIFCSPHIGHO2_01_FULL_44_64]|uniref:Uncharacterized protein n=1 Tax=Candidatus Blackburnbacteria bacterium RIFCSPHIGHO2_02_FULL_44_20 TaxID=1797516 RepID=A0A1G1V5J0_9BACT|nr:MAG: hypothetical protein A2700_00695 [Candidatus Blackburnbacteria bacterium RIFCSPHIGHO2_01_FULL_44_64]OGY10552.1 MAG: hypothetical protein A3D26_00430 [Candidatus Blackburnbacteria bacterium RIFCSPHIGHO2_02_FULL_44_20]OGY11638.1 MAG: hypothetical protein A3E16_01405 [Candidatus Blackburnbacteria bacterium RIFCSPHIGHO2_12_FULL_44_25]OGY14751.1 MAG: hypothetical protein A3A62_03095 [Candidatus Blackburnbacteria bacterium RIFCSPLOWO2_01_FULL_44_43]OGY15579.1 MAG: hypothetical protein A3H88_0
MKKLSIFTALLFVAFWVLGTVGPVYAKDYSWKQSDGTTTVTTSFPDQIQEGTGSITTEFRSDSPYFDKKNRYALTIHRKGTRVRGTACEYTYNVPGSSDELTVDSQLLKVTWNILDCNRDNPRGDWTMDVWSGPPGSGFPPYVNGRVIAQFTFPVIPKGGEPKLVANCKVKESQPLTFQIENVQAGTSYTLWLHNAWEKKTYTFPSAGIYTETFMPGNASHATGKRRLCMDLGKDNNKTCRYFVDLEYVAGTPKECKLGSGSTSSLPGASTTAGDPTKPFRYVDCGGSGGSGVPTALGCIPTSDSNALLGWFLKWAYGLSGGVALIVMIMAGFQIMTSSGNPEKIQGGRELLNAAISGLLLVIFSAFLLKLIGVDILGIPGLN